MPTSSVHTPSSATVTGTVTGTAPAMTTMPWATRTRTRIKMCGFTRKSDVTVAVQLGVDAIGLVLYPKSPRYVTPEQASELASGLPPFVTPVLLFVNASEAEVLKAVQAVPSACLQFHGDETPEQCLRLSQRTGRPYIRAARIPRDAAAAARFDLLEFAAHYTSAQALLLDAHVEGYGGGGHPFSWSQLPPNVNAHLVLSGGLTPANVIDGISTLRTRGLSLAVDVSSGIELAKGQKDAALMQAFVQAVQSADLAAGAPSPSISVSP